MSTMLSRTARLLGFRSLPTSLEPLSIAVRENETLVALAVPEGDSPLVCRFDLARGATLLLRTLVHSWASTNFSVFLGEEGASADVRAVVISEWGKPSSYSSKTVSTASKTRACSDVAAFSLPEGDLSITTVAEIGSNVSGGYAEAVQSNVFFGDSGKLRGVPELRIGSDDVKARHACSVERFSDEKLFYLRSRWMEKDDAIATLIASKVSQVFSGLPSEALRESESLCVRAIRAIVGE